MKEAERQKLWDNYMKTKSPQLREQLILEYANVVNLVAGRLSMYLGYTVEYDDLVGYGIFGLIDAIDKFDTGKNVKFETYASLRIRGAILDQIRKMDWIPRTLRQKQKKMETAAASLEAAYGRPATADEIADELGISREEYDGWKSEAEFTNMVSLDDYLEQGSEGRIETFGAKFQQPEKVVEKQELKQMLVEALKTLTENEQKVITFYYYEELTLKEISQILSVSESRVSQLHTKALQKIKNQLGDSVDLLNLF
ncbi:MAG: FliA/WhiG family RNA polymerase sigma factor [Lachnospiraceae bacterium]|nr:FliA/WhiG family RNA polymerase sigma factor [Lachnospiraceae bacterium]